MIMLDMIIGYIAYTYPDYDSWDFEELYLTFDFYGVYVTYASGMDSSPMIIQK